MSGVPRILRAGDSTLVVEFEERIDPAVSDRAIALADAIASEGLAGIRDVVPTYRSVAVYFDPLRTDVVTLLAGLEREARRLETRVHLQSSLFRVPVCYGGAFGPDLAAVAAWSGISEEEVVALHLAPKYRVFMLGFVPGFAYLGEVDARIAMPRRDVPRVRVPRGAVGVAGKQTGVYPSETPGGWQIIGRTSVRMFDLSRPEPFLLKPGDAVEFYRVEAAELDDVVPGEVAA